MTGNFPPLWPVAASAHAAQVDHLVLAFFGLACLLTAPVFILIAVFAVRYRRGRAVDRSHPASRNVWLETSWALIPFAFTLVFFWQGARLFDAQRDAGPDPVVVNVVGKQWMWKFEHPGGQREINELHLPAGRRVQLVMTSQDVIHSLFVPALREKQDAVPGRYTRLAFTPDRPGEYAIRCAEFCGFDHAVMGGRLVVMAPRDYASWLAHWPTDGSLAVQGERLFQASGCGGCHGVGSTVRSPPLDGLFGHSVPLQDGRIVTADAAYLRNSILRPNKDIVAGYPAVMPTFEGRLDEAEVLRLVAYLQSLSPDAEDMP